MCWALDYSLTFFSFQLPVSVASWKPQAYDGLGMSMFLGGLGVSIALEMYAFAYGEYIKGIFIGFDG